MIPLSLASQSRREQTYALVPANVGPVHVPCRLELSDFVHLGASDLFPLQLTTLPAEVDEAEERGLLEDADKMLGVNVTGVFMTAQAVARQMIRLKQGGSMVLIASMSGTVANRD